MATVTYRPAEVLHWLEIGSKEAKQKARSMGQSMLSGSGFVQGLKDAAGAASEFGRGAITDLVQRKAEETSYIFSDESMEWIGLTSRKSMAFKEITEIRAKPHDRFEVVYKSGSLTIKPIAHLLSGRLRVPVGWMRNGMEVPYALLIEELAARAGVEIFSE